MTISNFLALIMGYLVGLIIAAIIKKFAFCVHDLHEQQARSRPE